MEGNLDYEKNLKTYTNSIIIPSKLVCNITIEIWQVQICHFFEHRLSIVQMPNSIRWVKYSNFWMFFMIVLKENGRN
jgi:hypothetical protein